MPKALFVALHRPDRSPSQRFRYEQYIDFLIENGWEVELSYLIKERWDKPFYSSGNYLLKFWVLFRSVIKRFKDISRANNFDVIYVQREALMIGSSFFEKKLSKSKAKLIYDFDDAIWLPNTSEANQNLAWLKFPDKVQHIIRVSDLVIAGNEHLADYARKFNKSVVVFPTTINTNRHMPSAEKDKTSICIGWTGSKTTIPHFELAIPFLKKLKRKYGNEIEIKVIGDGTYKNEELEVKAIDWNLDSEIEELQEIDIGIMPLPNDEWAKGKCGLKSLQYMSLKIPCVISPVGMNVSLIKHQENGFLASEIEDWEKYLSMLIDDERLRRKIGENARITVMNEYSVESNKAKFLKYFNDLMKVG